VDRKIILWALVAFFGCSILFREIDALASSGGKGTSVAIQALVMVAIIGTIVLIARMRR
jgi:uncharacterized membrane protein